MTLQETHERYVLLLLLRAVNHCPVTLPDEIRKAAEAATTAVDGHENEYDITELRGIVGDLLVKNIDWPGENDDPTGAG